MEHRLNELSKGWVRSSLGEVCIRITKGSTPTSYGYTYKKEGIKFIKAENIDENGSIGEISDFINGETNQFLKRSILEPNDILFSIAGTIGRVGYIQEKDLPANTNQALAIVRCPWNFISNKYFFHFLKSPFIQNKALNSIVGVGRANISLTDISEFAIPLPPLPEQHRIVAKIEELFTKLDAGVEALKKIKAQLKRYRQAVLKYAFEGKLTQEWREANKGKIEPASVLLEKIKEERRKETKGKFKELPPVNKSELPELPEGWVWITFSQLISSLKNSIKRGPFGSTVKKAFFVEKGFKVYEQQNAIYDNPRLGNYYISQDKFNELIGFEVKPEDFIVSCSGTIGKITQLPHNAERGIINQALLKLTIDRRLVVPKFFLEFFRSDQFQTKLLKETRGSAIKNINSVEDIKIIPVPLPPLVEQQKIVEEIDSRLSIAGEVEKIAEQSLKQSERLHQSILKKAFGGKLVPQDPTDEPASMLLERIRLNRQSKDGKLKIRAHRGSEWVKTS